MSVIVPCRNEACYLEDCLVAIRANDYPSDRIEVLVVDGRSSDQSRAITGRFGTLARLIDNPAGSTPAALNLGIKAARGEIIIRVDARSRIADDYIRQSVDLLTSTGAANVGGVMQTQSRSRAVALALSHPFGVGPSASRIGKVSLSSVDTVYGGCWARTTLEQVGGFNDGLLRGQDLELNLRLTRAGQQILLSPRIRSTYVAPASVRELLRKRWIDGVWVILPFRYARSPVRWRHVAPMGFVFAACAFPPIAAVYGAVAFCCAFFLALRERNPSLGPLLLVAFVGSHLSYGLGSWWGLATLLLGQEGYLGGRIWHERRIEAFRS